MAISVDTDICLQSYCGVNFGANTIGIMFAVCCSVLQCVAVCCSVLQYVAVILWSQLWCKHNGHNVCSVLQCVAVCCSVLQCVAVCCSVLQCVAVCCSHIVESTLVQTQCALCLQ